MPICFVQFFDCETDLANIGSGVSFAMNAGGQPFHFQDVVSQMPKLGSTTLVIDLVDCGQRFVPHILGQNENGLIMIGLGWSDQNGDGEESE